MTWFTVVIIVGGHVDSDLDWTFFAQISQLRKSLGNAGKILVRNKRQERRAVMGLLGSSPKFLPPTDFL